MTGIRVMSPREAIEQLPANSCIHVMNPNYLDEVKGVVNGRHHVTPLGGFG